MCLLGSSFFFKRGDIVLSDPAAFGTPFPSTWLTLREQYRYPDILRTSSRHDRLPERIMSMKMTPVNLALGHGTEFTEMHLRIHGCGSLMLSEWSCVSSCNSLVDAFRDQIRTNLRLPSSFAPEMQPCRLHVPPHSWAQGYTSFLNNSGSV